MGVERLESGWFSWATGCLGVVPSLISRGGLATRAVTQKSSPILSVRTCSSIRSAAARPSLRGFCLKDGTPIEGCPATVRRCCPVTPAGVMEWCAGKAIITAWEAVLVDSLSRCVVRATRPALCPCQGVLWITYPRREERNGHRGSLYRTKLDWHARCTGRQSWSAQPGSLSTALTRGC